MDFRFPIPDFRFPIGRCRAIPLPERQECRRSPRRSGFA
jgi:hypothetical protein